jgi:hypothetical protein
MKTIALVFVVALAASTAVGQDAREITREMGADTTTSVSPGTDRHGIHRDTEKALEDRHHTPNLLESAQGTKPEKISPSEKKRLLKKRGLLLKDRKAVSDAAVSNAKKEQAAAAKLQNFARAEKTFTVDEVVVRKKAERSWDSSRGGELSAIDRALKESRTQSQVRLHAPSLVTPR